jgi:hypothetical protein
MKLSNKNKCNVVLSEVLIERVRQESMWGQQNHSPLIWLGILAEEFGEAAREANDIHFKNTKKYSIAELEQRYRTELIQVAAVAVAMVESLDRNRDKGGNDNVDLINGPSSNSKQST